jgi:hypothetical protein
MEKEAPCAESAIAETLEVAIRQGDAEAPCYRQEHAVVVWELRGRRRQTERKEPMMTRLL